jgi:hypothetical protein
MVRGTWARGHASRGRAEIPLLPSPDQPFSDDDYDLGELEPEPDPASGSELTPGPAPDAGDGRGEAPAAEPAPDPRPGPVGKTGARRGRPPGRITKAIRDDIEGKLGIMLEIPGRIWQARDPLCGGAFVAQAPAIREAAVDLILMSPDLIEWFTGVGGGFMLWLNLFVACQPVAVTIWAHHVAHTIELPEGDQAPGARQYAA